MVDAGKPMGKACHSPRIDIAAPDDAGKAHGGRSAHPCTAEDEGPSSRHWGECYTAAILKHAFQALKGASHEEFPQVLESPAARVAGEAGRRLDLRPDWGSVKIEVMRDLVSRKVEEDGLAVRL